MAARSNAGSITAGTGLPISGDGAASSRGAWRFRKKITAIRRKAKAGTNKSGRLMRRIADSGFASGATDEVRESTREV